MQTEIANLHRSCKPKAKTVGFEGSSSEEVSKLCFMKFQKNKSFQEKSPENLATIRKLLSDGNQQASSTKLLRVLMSK